MFRFKRRSRASDRNIDHTRGERKLHNGAIAELLHIGAKRQYFITVKEEAENAAEKIFREITRIRQIDSRVEYMDKVAKEKQLIVQLTVDLPHLWEFYLNQPNRPDSGAVTLAYGAMSGHIFETFAVSEILKSFANSGQDYRYFVSYYRGHDKLKQKIDGKVVEAEGEIDLIIEADGVLHPIEIKQNGNVSPAATGGFQVLDKVPDRQRGIGAVVCTCQQPGMLRENVLELPVWYI